MKIKFLGTGGAEGFPALACSCSYCTKAKRLKGKDIRTRSQTIIDSRLLIDFGPDTLAHFHQHNINFNKIWAHSKLIIMRYFARTKISGVFIQNFLSFFIHFSPTTI